MKCKRSHKQRNKPYLIWQMLSEKIIFLLLVLSLTTSVFTTAASANASDTMYLMEGKRQLCYSQNIFQPSNIPAQDFDRILYGTAFEGYGVYLVELEETYNVNALLGISIATHESAMGYNPLPHNNYFGMLGSKFNSLESNILFFGKLMHGTYYEQSGIYTLDDMAYTYCPKGTEHWRFCVGWWMREYWYRLYI